MTSKQKRNRATKVGLQERHDHVMACLRQGIAEAVIRKSIVEKYGVCDRQAKRYIDDVWETVGGLGSRASDKQVGLLSSRIDHLYSLSTMGPDKNIQNAIKLLQLSINLLPKTKENRKKHVKSLENHSRDTVTPQLAKILEKLDVEGHAEEPSVGLGDA